MSNPEFRLVDPFPISTRPHTPTEVALAEAEPEQLRTIRVFYSSADLIDAIVEDGDRGDEARGAAESALKVCPAYKEWQRAMPCLKDVLEIHRYRRNLSKDLAAVNLEILSVGGYLCAGQVLYRGAQFTSVQILTNEPISTSMNPSVARWHALEVGGQIAVLTIGASHSVRAFAYKTSGHQGLKHECEVLLQSGLRLELTTERTIHGVGVRHYDVSAL